MVGIFVRDLGPSELAWRLIRQANDRSARGLDTLFFHEQPAPPCLPVAAACMSAMDCWGYRGPVIATNLAGAKKLAGFPAPSRRIFYVWDLEWLRMAERPFPALRSAYADPRLTLVARSESHAHLLEDLWCRPVARLAVPDANIEAILEASRG